MSRKSIAADLLAEEAVVNSPVRRSSRLINGNAAVNKGPPQTNDNNIPAKVTRSRRASAQEAEQKTASKLPANRRKSMLNEEETTQKEKVSTPARRGRKPSVTDPADAQETGKSTTVKSRRTSTTSQISETEENPPEKPKPRGRRVSTAEKNDEEKPAPARSRRSSVNAETEANTKVVPKTTAGVVTRRRSLAMDKEETSTPNKQTHRSRKVSDTEEIISESTKPPVTRGRRRSVAEEEPHKEESIKTGTRKSLIVSTGDNNPVDQSKTPGRPSSINNIVDNDAKEDTIENISDVQELKIQLSPIDNVKLTPLKKRKIVERVELEMDLSIINESNDDLEPSQHDTNKDVNNYNKEMGQDKNVENKTNSNTSLKSIKSPDIVKTPENKKSSPVPNKIKSPKQQSTKNNDSYHTPKRSSSRLMSISPEEHRKKRSIDGEDSNPSPRKSPRLMNKYMKDMSTVETSPRNTGNINQSFDTNGSFKFNLSKVSITNTSVDETQRIENIEVLNASSESSGSNKENIENIETETATLQNPYNGSLVNVPEEQIESRVSNVFKPNQKEYSFVEAMEVDEYSVVYSETSVSEKNIAFDESTKIDKISGNILDEQKKEKIFETSDIVPSHSDQDKTQISVETGKANRINNSQETVEHNQSESQINFFIEETSNSVNFMIKQKVDESELNSDKNGVSKEDISPIKNRLSENLNVVLRKSSTPNEKLGSKSPLLQGGVSRRSKSKSPVGDKTRINSPIVSNVKANSPFGCKSPVGDKTECSLNSPTITNFNAHSPSDCESLADKKVECRLSKGSTNLIGSPNQNETCDNGSNNSLKHVLSSPSTTLQSKQSKSPLVISPNLKSPSHIPSLIEKNNENIYLVPEKFKSHISPKPRLSQSPNDNKTQREEITDDDLDIQSPSKICGSLVNLNIGLKETAFEEAIKTPSDLKNTSIVIESEDPSDSLNSKTVDHLELNKSTTENTLITNKIDIILNSSCEESQLRIKNRESTYYDFDLPSDEDDLSSKQNYTKENHNVNKSIKDRSDIVEASTSVSSSSPKKTPIRELLNKSNTEKEETHSMCKTTAIEDDHVNNEAKIKNTEDFLIHSNGKEVHLYNTGELHDQYEGNTGNTKSQNEVSAKTEINSKDNVKEREQTILEKSIVVETVNKSTASISVKDANCTEDTNEKITHEQPIKNKTLNSSHNNSLETNNSKIDSKTSITNSVEPKSLKAMAIDEFASAKLDEYILSKMKDLENGVSDDEHSNSSEEDLSGITEEDESEEYNEFIDGMAEEGEEDTPSEDSNQIVDEGESLGSIDSRELSESDYENNSFICDDEEIELLSGEEYDLYDEPKKEKTKSRIIDNNTLGDNEIIRINQRKKAKNVKPQHSRIITVSDSSDDENPHILLPEDKDSVPPIDQSDLESNKTSTQKEEIVTEELPVEENGKVEDLETSNVIVSNNKTVLETSVLNVSNKRQKKSSITIHENIVVDGEKNTMIAKRINSLVDSFCSTVTKGEISVNLSLEIEESAIESKPDTAKTDTVNVLSDVKICSLNNKVDEKGPNQSAEPIEDSRPNVSLNDVDLRDVINKNRALKRRLSKSVSDLTSPKKKRRRNKKKVTSDKNVSEDVSKDTYSKKAKKHIDLKHELKMSTFNIMDQLITDVKNRPKRTLKPSVTSNDSWNTTIIENLKPSTSTVCRKERIKLDVDKTKQKFHPKDFRNQLLSDETRVKRIETVKLLKKKGAFF